MFNKLVVIANDQNKTVTASISGDMRPFQKITNPTVVGFFSNYQESQNYFWKCQKSHFH